MSEKLQSLRDRMDDARSLGQMIRHLSRDERQTLSAMAWARACQYTGGRPDLQREADIWARLSWRLDG